jgi:hypothetical protein
MNKSTTGKRRPLMIKNHRRLVALLVTITFAWLLQASAMPLAANDKTEEAGQASAEQAPGFVEQQGPEWNHTKKINPIRIVIIVIVGYVALSLLYLLIHGIDIGAAPREGLRSSGASRERIAIR